MRPASAIRPKTSGRNAAGAAQLRAGGFGGRILTAVPAMRELGATGPA